MKTILQIAITGPFRQTFDYISHTQPPIGSRVKVPFGNREVIGVVISHSDRSLYSEQLKPIIQVIDKATAIPKELLDLIQWTSQYYHHPIGDCFKTALPNHLFTQQTLKVISKTYWQYNQPTSSIRYSQKQQIIIDHLKEKKTVLQSELYQRFNINKAVLKQLEKKGSLISIQNPYLPYYSNKTDNLIPPNSQQKACIDTVLANKNQFLPYLLYGITGSGKTNLYLHLSKEIVKQKQILILIPEIGLIQQMLTIFQNHYGYQYRLFSYHSGMTDRERTHTWLAVKSGDADIIIGTRSAVFLPFKQLGLIVVDEEHDSAYKQQDSLRYHAKHIALIRARKHRIPIVLGSATPSLDSYYRVKDKQYHLLSLTQRATGALLPKVQLIDNPAARRHSSGLSHALYQAIKETLNKGEQVILFINQRGYAPIVICQQCQWQGVCPDCDTRLIFHQKKYQLKCHHCGYTQPMLKQCPQCHSDKLNHYGLGTQQIEENLQHYFPEHILLRIDRDSTQKVNAFKAITQQIHTGKPAILVGTQMLTKGHDFHHVTLVGVVEADQGLFSPDFQMIEALAQLITQVIGRAGRGQKPGKVYIQTEQIEHPFWQLIFKDYLTIAEQLLMEREVTKMPPISHFAILHARSKKPQLALQVLSKIAEKLQQTERTLAILGPAPAVMEKKAGYYRAQLLFMTEERRQLHQTLDNHMQWIDDLCRQQRLKWAIDIDPINLLS